MSDSREKVTALLDLANLYPSPHNGQPIRLKWDGDRSFELYFQKERGLQAADISFIFSFVTMGVYIEHLTLAAQALGHRLTYQLQLPPEASLKGSGLECFARCRVTWHAGDPDAALEATLRRRQTSRRKYYAGVDEALLEGLVRIAENAHMELHCLDKQQAREAIWLNQRAVFDDMFDEGVRRELDHWLRYSRSEKERLMDGLAYDCMQLNGAVMRYIVRHPQLLRAQGISWLLREYYLRTMTDASNVCYLMAPFATEREAFEVGIVIMKFWYQVAAQGYFLHPFGTIMSNHAAHKDFAKLAQITDESRAGSYLVFIFRCGKSKPPVRSLRLPVQHHMLMSET